MASNNPEWDILRRRIRVLETSLDAKLALYSGLATRVASGLSASGSASGRLRRSVYGSYPLSDTSYANGDEDDVVLDMNPHAQRAQQEASEIADDENEIETLLSELSGAVMRIDELADPDGRGVASVSVQAALRRHREVLRDLENDYARLHGNVRDAQAKRDLLGNVRSDIQSYKQRQQDEASSHLADRGRLDNSGRILDEATQAAYAVRDDLVHQRETMTGAVTRLGQTAAQFPGINRVITLINRRRRRDSAIVGLVMGLGTIAILSYVF